MVATSVPPLPDIWIDTATGRLTHLGRAFMQAMRTRIGGTTDKVERADATAADAVPKATQVVSTGGLQVGGDLGSHVSVALYKIETTVAALPATGNRNGDWAFAFNGRKNGEGAAAGTGTPVWWDGSSGHWKAADTGATVAA